MLDPKAQGDFGRSYEHSVASRGYVRRMKVSMKLVTALAVALVPVSVLATGVTAPTEGYFERQTLKGFTTLASREFHAAHRDLFPNNGFQNQFTGFHAGTDVEFNAPADLSREIAVRSIADGTVVYVGDVAGYGGVLVIRHERPEPVTSLYGHVRLRDAVPVGTVVTTGQVVAYLGVHFSAETSGARKHLHFGIHRGSELDLAGHLPSREAVVAEWHDPNAWLQRYIARPTPAAVLSPGPEVRPVVATEPAKPKSFWQKIADFFNNIF